MRWNLLLPDFDRLTALWSEHWGYLLRNAWATFSVAAFACVLAAGCSIMLAVLALRLKWLRVALAPIVAVSQSFPLQAIAPLLIIVLGIGFHTKASIAFLISFFPMYAGASVALHSTPKALLDRFRISEASFAKTVTRLRIPAAMPTLIATLKVGFVLGLLGAVVAEFINPDRGLGYLLVLAQSSYDIEMIYSCVFLLAMCGLSIYTALTVLEGRLLRTRDF